MVDVDNEIDWHESHVLLKAAFPVAASGPFATYEIPYGSIERPTTRNNSWEKAQFEVPAMRWADLGDGKHGLSFMNQYQVRLRRCGQFAAADAAAFAEVA